MVTQATQVRRYRHLIGGEWVNTTIDGGPQLPAGGFKASGFGREMGAAGLEEFTEIKSVLYHLGKREPTFGTGA
jgi:betaine-aldehyde dehydrogenase